MKIEIVMLLGAIAGSLLATLLDLILHGDDVTRKISEWAIFPFLGAFIGVLVAMVIAVIWRLM